MKYFSGRLGEKNGDQEYSYDFLIKAKNKKEAQEQFNSYASTFYGSGDSAGEPVGDTDGRAYIFAGGGIYVEADEVTPTTKIAFAKYLLRAYTI